MIVKSQEAYDNGPQKRRRTPRYLPRCCRSQTMDAIPRSIRPRSSAAKAVTRRLRFSRYTVTMRPAIRDEPPHVPPIEAAIDAPLHQKMLHRRSRRGVALRRAEGRGEALGLRVRFFMPTASSSSGTAINGLTSKTLEALTTQVARLASQKPVLMRARRRD
jgi:hypothetical protein